jgi:branched-chain amino acid transport system substrate-binding protein
LAFVLAPAQTHADGTIAVIGPTSGPRAALGAAIREAVAPSETRGFNVVFDDDACEAGKAVEAAHRAVAARAAVVIGHPCSSAAIAAAPIYAAAQIPFIATGARHGDLTDKRAGPMVFRLSGRDDRQGKDAATFLAQASGGRPIAILHDRTFAMSTIAGDAATALTGPAGQPPAHRVMQFPFVASELNYDALVEKVIAFAGSAENVGAVLFAGFPAEAIVVLKALRARGVTASFLGVDALATGELGAVATADMGNVRVLISAPRSTVDLTPSVRTHIAPSSIDLVQSTAVRIWTATAIGVWTSAAKANAANPGAALANISYDDEPLVGRITFDAKGDAVVPSYLVGAWRDGAWKPAAAPEADKIPLP